LAGPIKGLKVSLGKVALVGGIWRNIVVNPWGFNPLGGQFPSLIWLGAFFNFWVPLIVGVSQSEVSS